MHEHGRWSLEPAFDVSLRAVASTRRDLGALCTANDEPLVDRHAKRLESSTPVPVPVLGRAERQPHATTSWALDLESKGVV